MEMLLVYILNLSLLHYLESLYLLMLELSYHKAVGFRIEFKDLSSNQIPSHHAFITRILCSASYLFGILTSFSKERTLTSRVNREYLGVHHTSPDTIAF